PPHDQTSMLRLYGDRRGILPDPISGTAVLEYGATEILPPVGAILKHPACLCRPGRQASRAQPRGKPGFSTREGSSGRETDSPLEGDGFELPVPGHGELCRRAIPRSSPASPVRKQDASPFIMSALDDAGLIFSV